uniref:Uncharacterized protein n=1 Tax=Nelumbo nucifera TaxID=4432 RepID=A0A822ZQN3_NELNU|nr:TPA_asm: hypothetical protein HUJ06_002348 [Nelumbo nucifera]
MAFECPSCESRRKNSDDQVSTELHELLEVEAERVK